MRFRAWLILSLGLNILLGAGWYSAHLRQKPNPLPKPISRKSFNPFDFYIRTNVVVRRQHFTWQEVEASDYAIYIKNLRTIGCPEQTIRDIIVADVNQLYAHRRSTEVVTNDFQWWRSEPDLGVTQEAWQKAKNLEEERRALLTRLLGSGWDKATAITTASTQTGVSLSGPWLGELSDETKQHVYDLADQAQKKREAYFQAQKQSGAPLDSAELERMRQTFRAGLAQVLSPEQLEEYLLRYSETAERMRREYRGVELSAEEFRAVFRVRDPAEQEIALLNKEQNPAVTRRLDGLQTQVETVLQRTLGAERYAAFKLNQDPLFRETKTHAGRLGVSSEHLLALYKIKQIAEVERRKIRIDAQLSPQEKIEALAAAQVVQQKSMENLLGPEMFQRWLDLQEKK